MKICFICKYPPIQGGVSMHCYWAARGLAQRGHQVFVVTNANEVETTFRIHLSEADRAAGGEYAKIFPENSGEVRVYSTEPPDRRQLYYIPINNPTVTRLSTAATNLIRTENCKVIFAYYLEPYGLAAHLAGYWTEKPYVFKHAGSDLNRLMRLDELQAAYLEVMARANRIISHGTSRKQLLNYGIPEERINSDVAFGVPTEYFHPDAPILDINTLFVELAKSDSVEGKSQWTFTPLDKSLPVLGIYGKLGEYKGSFDLIYAMAQLIRSGFPFYLVAISHGWQEHHFLRFVDELGISEYVRLLPFLPHWKIPGFIRSCTALAFLERDFPITAHMPTIPTEVIACGKCLVLSEEVARKQVFRMTIRNRKNIVIVPDPKQHNGLAECLRYALENPQRADEIGLEGLRDFGVSQAHETYIDSLETLLTQVATEAPVPRKVTYQSAEPRSRRDVIEMTGRLFPFTYACMSEIQKEQIREAIAGSSLGSGIADRNELAVELGRKLLSILGPNGKANVSPSYEVCQYESKLHEFVRNNRIEKDDEPRISFSVEEIGPLFPSIQGRLEIVDFSYDIEMIITAIEAGEAVPEAKNGIKVLFHTGSGPIRINEPTEYLVRLLDQGSLTMEEIFKHLENTYPCENDIDKAKLMESCLSLLEGLYWEGILKFIVSSSPSKNSDELPETIRTNHG